MATIKERVIIRCPEITDAMADEMIASITDRLLLRLGNVATLPTVFNSIAVDAVVKMYRRIYYEGISSEGAANITASFIDDILSEYDKEIEGYLNAEAAEGNGAKEVHFL